MIENLINKFDNTKRNPLEKVYFDSKWLEKYKSLNFNDEEECDRFFTELKTAVDVGFEKFLDAFMRVDVAMDNLHVPAGTMRSLQKEENKCTVISDILWNTYSICVLDYIIEHEHIPYLPAVFIHQLVIRCDEPEIIYFTIKEKVSDFISYYALFKTSKQIDWDDMEKNHLTETDLSRKYLSKVTDENDLYLRPYTAKAEIIHEIIEDDLMDVTRLS